ncbi:MAG: hypothetical protein ACOY4Q_13145 [Bacillota bacterium]
MIIVRVRAVLAGFLLGALVGASGLNLVAGRHLDRAELEIETAVKKLLKNLRGQEVHTLDPMLITNIVDRRFIETFDHKYRLTVKGTLVSEKIVMYVEAEELTENPL